MKNLLCGVFVDIILPIIILILAIVLSIFLYKRLQKKFNKPLDLTPKQNEKPLVNIKSNYCTEDEMKFLEAIHKALPRDCIAFPHVAVTKLIEPKGNMLDFKSVEGKFVDICVFLRKDMKPILVIDLFHPSPIAQQLKKFDDYTNNILKTIKIPVLHKQIQKGYNTEELLIEILNILDGKIVTYLKNKMIPTTNKK